MLEHFKGVRKEPPSPSVGVEGQQIDVVLSSVGVVLEDDNVLVGYEAGHWQCKERDGEQDLCEHGLKFWVCFYILYLGPCVCTGWLPSGTSTATVVPVCCYGNCYCCAVLWCCLGNCVVVLIAFTFLFMSLQTKLSTLAPSATATQQSVQTTLATTVVTVSAAGSSAATIETTRSAALPTTISTTLPAAITTLPITIPSNMPTITDDFAFTSQDPLPTESSSALPQGNVPLSPQIIVAIVVACLVFVAAIVCVYVFRKSKLSKSSKFSNRIRKMNTADTLSPPHPAAQLAAQPAIVYYESNPRAVYENQAEYNAQEYIAGHDYNTHEYSQHHFNEHEYNGHDYNGQEQLGHEYNGHEYNGQEHQGHEYIHQEYMQHDNTQLDQNYYNSEIQPNAIQTDNANTTAYGDDMQLYDNYDENATHLEAENGDHLRYSRQWIEEPYQEQLDHVVSAASGTGRRSL